ncbi:M9 family metallopeptidase [Streptomyces sp. C11-1]|uniref:microbial collagenase n=1 Tax=Streptomyces durocortorensis TaxID=2811104 RepID=A0ABY9W1U6_9ACTN|nr:M9 family metallopeptidase [Streptomyces durocortorensis]WNF30131.1 M9 family metallopeptidase [Streptomyces durocortorensis]
MCMGLTLLGGPAYASAAPSPSRTAPSLSVATSPSAADRAEIPPVDALSRSGSAEPEHVRASALPVDERGPVPASGEERRRDYDEPDQGAAAAEAPCDPADFTSRTGAALVRRIKESTVGCVNTLFGLTGENARLAFREAQMVTVANALRGASDYYPGDDSTGVPQLVLYLRAGYYVQWYNEAAVGSYGPALTAAIRRGLDAFFASPRSRDVTDANGETLSEAVVLIDSARENARYLGVVEWLLTDYDSSYNALWHMRNAVNSTFTVLFRGHQLPAFVTAVTEDSSTADTVHSFASRTLGLLGTDHAFLTINAGRELARFLQYDALRPAVRPQVRGLLGRTSITGPTAPLWVGLAEMANHYDDANCAYFGTCDLPGRLDDAALPVRHECSDSLRIRAQEMSAAQLAATCENLADQDAFFHDIARDDGPVAGDLNTRLEVVVYDSSDDYGTYAGAMFGIDTDNGGMYLEGDPTAAGNQPRFIAYEAEWLRPDFQIWNLNHEYTHYLDGRFTMAGDFADGMTTPTVWWVEGFAEYVSYSYRQLTYEKALSEAGKRTYPLSTLFDTTYDNSDSARVYRWGYLAVRYMLQSHRADLDIVLGHYRAGDWNAARTHLKSTIGTRYDSDWYDWLTACTAGDCGGITDPPSLPECTLPDTARLDRDCARSGISVRAGDYAYLYLYVPAGTPRLRITTAGGTGNADLYHRAGSWPSKTSYTHRSAGPGNAETVTVNAPEPGWHYVSVAGEQAVSGLVVSAEY